MTELQLQLQQFNSRHTNTVYGLILVNVISVKLVNILVQL